MVKVPLGHSCNSLCLSLSSSGSCSLRSPTHLLWLLQITASSFLFSCFLFIFHAAFFQETELHPLPGHMKVRSLVLRSEQRT